MSFSQVVLFLRRSSDGAVQAICFPQVDNIFICSLKFHHLLSGWKIFFKKKSLQCVFFK